MTSHFQMSYTYSKTKILQSKGNTMWGIWVIKYEQREINLNTVSIMASKFYLKPLQFSLFLSLFRTLFSTSNESRGTIYWEKMLVNNKL